MEAEGSPKVIKTRRRGETLERELLRAAWDELTEAGWSDFQMERVAARCGAGKSSIYRRWPNRAALLLATFTYMSETSDPPVPPDGDLRTKLLAVLEDLATLLDGPFGSVVRGMAAAIADGNEWSGFAPPPAEAVAAIVADAIELGELRQEAFHPRLLGVGSALVIEQYLSTNRPPTPPDREEIVDLVWVPALQCAGRIKPRD